MNQNSGRRKENINTLAVGPPALRGNRRSALFPEHFLVGFAPALSPGGLFFAEPDYCITSFSL